ncbi:MAG: family 78 glycoside hydrolase catalytic domain [Clostridia bacterium]|nr:family 78 glycoside hydrolase catalytic domain [Clostridia bacterium]
MIKNLRVCDNQNQLAAEPPYRFTFEVENLSPKTQKAVILNQNGDLVWEQSGDYSKPYVLAKTELKRLENYTFKLTLFDENKELCTAETVFKVGLLGDFEDAQFISAAFFDTAPILHRCFEVESTENAVLYLLTLGFSKCYINGKPVSDDFFDVNSDYHKRSYEKMQLIYPLNDEFSYSQYYRAYDVSSLLEKGENHIAVVLGNGWYNQCARIAEGHMEYGEPKIKLMLKTASDTIVSDEDFESIESHIIYNQLFIGEMQDLTTPFAPALFGDADEISSVVLHSSEDAVLRAAHFPADKVINKITPTPVLNGEDFVIYDAGRNLSGVVEITTSAEYGEKITISYGENLTDKGELGCTYDQTDVYVASGREGEKAAPFFAWHGFRYFKVEGYVTDVTVLEIEADLKPEGDFKFTNELLNDAVKIYKNSQWSNMHCGVPSDCPHRERLGYTGDGQLTAGSAMYLADCRSFYRKWIRDIADGQCKKSGHVQHTAPFGGGGGGPAGWGGAMIILPWQYYLHYGEIDILEEYYQNMLRFSDYMESRSENNLVVREEKDGWCLGEWCTPEKVELTESYVNTCLYVKQLGILKQISELLGDYAVAGEIEQKIIVKRTAIKSTFLKDGVWDCGKQAAPLFAYAAGIISLDGIIPYLEEYRGGSLDTGILGFPLLIKAFFDADMGDTAVSLITRTDAPSVSSMVTRLNCTTLCENLNGNGSRNHPMFGSFVEIIIENMLGVNLKKETAGFTGDWRTAPIKGASGRIFTPNGYIDI